MPISRRSVINLAAFLALSVGLIAAGLSSLLDQPFTPRTELHTVLPTASGVRANFSVSHHGVIVGTVSGTRLTPTGVHIDFELHPGIEVPSNVDARIVRATPIGEQRLELRTGGSEDAPPLETGDEVPAAKDFAPPVVSDVAEEVAALIEAVPPDELGTIMRETTAMLEGRDREFHTLLRVLDVASERTLEYEDELRELLDAGPRALDAVVAAGDDVREAVQNTSSIVRTLTENRHQVVSILEEGDNLSREGSRLLEETAANLLCLTSDTADVLEELGSSRSLSNLDSLLLLNPTFFGTTHESTPTGRARDIGLGEHDQRMARVTMMVPPEEPSGQPNEPPRTIRPTRPGAACKTARLGAGAGPARQDPVPPPYPVGGTIDWPEGDSSDRDPPR